MEKVFVYGTLKRNRGNNRCFYRVDNKSQFISEAKTKEKYALYSAGIPFVTDEEQVCEIHGEVFEVTTETLTGPLDGLEGHPNWYNRKKIPVVLNTGEETEAWLYFMKNPRGKLVETGIY
jgi:gamma-glutamylaminecyclotransferase